eukprot:766589-Hanusia_phi.AAC.2
MVEMMTMEIVHGDEDADGDDDAGKLRCGCLEMAFDTHSSHTKDCRLCETMSEWDLMWRQPKTYLDVSHKLLLMHHNESMRGIGVTCYSHNGKDLYCNKPAEGWCCMSACEYLRLHLPDRSWKNPRELQFMLVGVNDSVCWKGRVGRLEAGARLRMRMMRSSRSKGGSVYAVANAASSASASGDASSTASGAAPGAAADPAASSAPATTPA